MPLPTNTGYDQTLNAISADGPNDVWAIGEYLDQVGSTLRWETFALHWNGSTWSDVTMPLVSGSDTSLVYQINSMDAISPTNVWAVGGSGDNASPTAARRATRSSSTTTARRGASCPARTPARMTT